MIRPSQKVLIVTGLHQLRWAVFMGGVLLEQRLRDVALEFRRRELSQALHDLAVKGLNLLVPFRIFRGLVVERVEPESLLCPEPYTPMLLREGMIREFAKDRENEMTQSFVDEALSKGDECFGICDGDRLASYGWYAFGPTRIHPPDLLLRFDRKYVYMYKGFTHPLYRGQRLHATGMILALQHYLQRGYKGLISYVESDNLNSLKSVRRMGYQEFGSIYLIGCFGRYFKYYTGGCEMFDFAVEELKNESAAAQGLLPPKEILSRREAW